MQHSDIFAIILRTILVVVLIWHFEEFFRFVWFVFTAKDGESFTVKYVKRGEVVVKTTTCVWEDGVRTFKHDEKIESDEEL